MKKYDEIWIVSLIAVVSVIFGVQLSFYGTPEAVFASWVMVATVAEYQPVFIVFVAGVTVAMVSFRFMLRVLHEACNDPKRRKQLEHQLL